MTYSRLIFVSDLSYGLKFICCVNGFAIVPSPSAKKVIVSPLNCFASLSKISFSYMCGPIYVLSILFH